MSKFKIRLRKVLKIVAIVVLVLLILIPIAMNFLMPFKESDKKLKAYFEEKKVAVQIHNQEYKGKPIRFIETKGEIAPDSTLVVFVHGAPGSLSDHKAFLADSLLMAKARMISVDRLGYGGSHYGDSEPGIAEQSDFIKFIVDQYPHEKLVLSGHSFGGPIVAKFGMDHPDITDKVIMLAPLNEPASEPLFKISYFAKWKLTRWPLPKAINVSADEKFAHVAELEKLHDEWQSMEVPVVHIHGTKDFLAPISNIKFSEDHIPEHLLETIVLQDVNHFLPWSHYDLVKEVILKSLE